MLAADGESFEEPWESDDDQGMDVERMMEDLPPPVPAEGHEPDGHPRGRAIAQGVRQALVKVEGELRLCQSRPTSRLRWKMRIP